MAALGILLLVVHILVGVLMIIVILMQSSKGQGLSGAFGMGEGTTTFFGADTANVLVKITTVLAVIFMITAIALGYVQAQRARSVAGEAQKAETSEDLGTPPGEEEEGEQAADGMGATEDGETPEDGVTPGDGETPEDGAASEDGTTPGGTETPSGDEMQPSDDGGSGAGGAADGEATEPGAGETGGPEGGEDEAPHDTNS